MPKQKKICEICENTPAKYIEVFDKVLCEECRADPEFKLIYKTTTKTKYYLSDKDLETLESFETIANTSYKRNMAVTLFREADVINCLCAKHGVNVSQLDDLLIDLKNKRRKRSKKRADNNKSKSLQRKKKLSKALKDNGLVLRPDSKLCCGYINGTIKDMSIEEIVERMCQMKFLYEYTDMEAAFRKAKQEKTYEREYGCRTDLSLMDLAEMFALEDIGGYPDEWPWLEETDSEGGSDEDSETDSE